MGYELTNGNQYQGAMGCETGVYTGDESVAVHGAQDRAGVGGIPQIVD